ncbi:MAG: sulfatase [Planctomycetaceae bacterium]|nr:sulfatase [Planctomycetaceae bacterium]
MSLEQLIVREQTRRHFFSNAGLSIGSLGLASLMAGGELRGAVPNNLQTNPLAPRNPHFDAKAKRVIYLFMAGGPSQLELFDFKPKLQEMDGEVIPESYVEGKNFAFLKKDAQLLGTKRKFQKWGESGQEMSELLPHLGDLADKIAIIRSMKTDVFNHGPAKLFMNTGFQRFGRPSMGAWVTYGIGSESNNLPGFVVMHSGPRGPRGGTPLWGSGFLPTTYQGVPFLNGSDPILNLATPKGISQQGQGDFVNALKDLNSARLEQIGDPEIATRIATYEMAYRMQSSAPELMDLSKETQDTLDMYGIKDTGKPSFGRNCLLARRLVERGTRFVQLYHTDWDHHGNAGTNLNEALDARCDEVDQPAAALIKDLEARGLLEDTIVVWGGEFGRTPQGEPRDMLGRDHHIEAYSMWLCGGGVKGGVTVGETDELGYYSVKDQVHVHDLQATILHLLGLDHEKLTYRFQGRDFRLTDVGGNLVDQIIA